MAKKYQTKASLAEEQVLDMLKSERAIQRPWSLVSLSMKNRTLQTTAAEAAIIFNNHAFVRPGYEQNEKEVYIPNLFIKISGCVDDFNILQNRERLQKRENCFVFGSFHDFSIVNDSGESYEKYISNGLIDKDALLSSNSFRYTFLRKEYQDLLIEKINQILKSRQEYFIGKGLSQSDTEVVSCLLQMDEKYLYAFHNFDFQFQPPSVVISNKGREMPSVYQSLALLLLNLLGFDIIIESREGYSDIENVLHPDCYSRFEGNIGKSGSACFRNVRVALGIMAGAVLIAFIIIAAKGLPSNHEPINTATPPSVGLSENIKETEAVPKNSEVPIKPTQNTEDIKETEAVAKNSEVPVKPTQITEDIKETEAGPDTSEIPIKSMQITEGFGFDTDISSKLHTVTHIVYMYKDKLPPNLPESFNVGMLLDNDSSSSTIESLVSLYKNREKQVIWQFDGRSGEYYSFKDDGAQFAIFLLFDNDINFLGYYVYQIPLPY